MAIRIKKVCVYCGSSDIIHPRYLAAARGMGQELAGRGLTLVYGAGSTGMMGELADACLEAGGTVVGVIPEVFNTPQLAHQDLHELHITKDMHARKALLANMADAFIALPGGLGTFEELFEILTWAQIGLHAKPVGALNIGGYFDLLLDMIELARSQGFIYDEHQALLICEPTPEAVMGGLYSYIPPEGLARWVARKPGS
ncbi:MAG: TIGR00730 family Rossman fold protein [Anaerolineales bacterium]|jgi:uncharacterized protein (TIGR00730 family)